MSLGLEKLTAPISRRKLLGLIGLSSLALVVGTDTKIEKVKKWPAPIINPDPSIDTHLVLNDFHLKREKSQRKRLSTSSVAQKMYEVSENLSQVNFKRVLQLGDIITENPSDRHENEENLLVFLSLLQKFPWSIINLLGNHELWGLDKNYLSEQFHLHGFSNKFHGIEDFGYYQIIWLDIVCPDMEHGKVTAEQLEWLSKNLTNKPTIILSHYPIFPPDVRGHFYFETEPNKGALQNGAEVWQTLERIDKKIVISGHTHHLSKTDFQGTDLITLPAFSENIAAEDYSPAPGIYSTLEVHKNEVIIRSFYESFCFASLKSNFKS